MLQKAIKKTVLRDARSPRAVLPQPTRARPSRAQGRSHEGGEAGERGAGAGAGGREHGALRGDHGVQVRALGPRHRLVPVRRPPLPGAVVAGVAQVVVDEGVLWRRVLGLGAGALGGHGAAVTGRAGEGVMVAGVGAGEGIMGGPSVPKESRIVSPRPEV